MLYRDTDLVVTATRTPKPLSQVAENVSIVTADEIEAINAHTLADVLRYVNGVQTDQRGGPGSYAAVSIQGSDARHVRVMVDGVTLNSISSDNVEIGAFPVQDIDRIEIIKGPASSSWGSSLGGVINIITKGSDPDRRLGGAVSASIGEQGTADLRAALSGTTGDVGYYLSAGGLTSDGVTPATPFDGGNLYTKLAYQAASQTKLQFTLGYNRMKRGDGQDLSYGIGLGSGSEQLFSTAELTYDLRDDLSLDVSGRVIRLHSFQFMEDLASGSEMYPQAFDELNAGTSVKLHWQGAHQNLLAGFDNDNGSVDSQAIKSGKQWLETWAVYLNDTLTWGAFSATPGVRYDYTSTSGSFVSPSLGITYRPWKGAVLRASVARGFSAPPLFYSYGDGVFFKSNPNLKEESVWSYAVGLETPVTDYVVFKATGFRHDIDDVISFAGTATDYTAINRGKQRRQGVELELRTKPVLHTSLMAGYTYIDADTPGDGAALATPPRYTVDLGVDYNDARVGRGTLRGYFIRQRPYEVPTGRFHAVIWDLNLARTVVERDNRKVDLFFTAHNLLNGSQYTDSLFPNPRRWFEGGVRFRF